MIECGRDLACLSGNVVITTKKEKREKNREKLKRSAVFSYFILVKSGVLSTATIIDVRKENKLIRKSEQVCTTNEDNSDLDELLKSREPFNVQLICWPRWKTGKTAP